MLNLEAEADADDEQLTLLVDALPNLVASVSSDLRYRLVNAAYERWFERPREAILGRTIAEIMGEEAFRLRLPRIEAALRGEHQRFESLTPKPDGAKAETEIEYLPRRGATGEVEGFYVVVTDITERKRAERELAASETRLRLALQAGQMGEWELDVATDTSIRALRHDQIFGYEVPIQEWGFETFIGHVLPQDREQVESAFRKAAEQGSGWHFQCRIRRANDGQVRWIEAHSEPQVGQDGRVARVFGLVRDITEHREGHERLRQVLDELFAFVGVMTPDGTLIEANRAPLEAAGIAAEEVLGRPFWEAYWWSYDAGVQDQLRHAVYEAAAGQVVRYDVPVRMAGGALLTIDFQLAPLRDEDGNISHLIPSGVLVEDRVHAEAELRRLNAELEQRVLTAVAEREQAQEALRQSQKMEAVGQLTGGIAHDFNNLLAAVIGNLDMILRKPDDEARVRRWAGNALQAAERGSKLTGQLLAFSRAQRIEARPLIVSHLIRDLKDMLSSTLGPLIELRLELDEARVPVLSDPPQLEMAVLNLAINARDAMTDGGILTIRTVPRIIGQDPDLEPGEYVELAVSDSGHGMPPEVAARAFDPFFTTKRVGEGTGLGLSQVYGIARQGGGTARIESQAGSGTTVRLFLRRTEAECRPEESYGEEQEVQLRGSATLLVVDDDPDVRAFLADSLLSLGYKVAEAIDGHSGLEELERVSPDLMIIDFAMPGLNGAEVAKLARERRPDLPLLFVSGYSDTAAIEEAVGPDTPLLRKPFKVEGLRAAVEQALCRASPEN